MKEKLTIEEFRKLPRDEQNIRYRELSDHDKFLARIGDYFDPDDSTPVDWEEFKKNPPKGWEHLIEHIENIMKEK